MQNRDDQRLMEEAYLSIYEVDDNLIDEGVSDWIKGSTWKGAATRVAKGVLSQLPDTAAAIDAGAQAIGSDWRTGDIGKKKDGVVAPKGTADFINAELAKSGFIAKPEDILLNKAQNGGDIVVYKLVQQRNALGQYGQKTYGSKYNDKLKFTLINNTFKIVSHPKQ